MSGTSEATKKLNRADLVAAAVEQNRDIWVRMALGITSDVYDAEDAVQEAISKVLTGPGILLDADSAGRYLTRSVRNCAIDRVRDRIRHITFAEPDELGGPRLAPVDADQEDRFVQVEIEDAKKRLLKRMLEELQSLPKHQREAIELLVLHEPPLKLREAEEVTGVAISTLHSRLKSALKSLRKILSESEE